MSLSRLNRDFSVVTQEYSGIYSSYCDNPSEIKSMTLRLETMRDLCMTSIALMEKTPRIKKKDFYFYYAWSKLRLMNFLVRKKIDWALLLKERIDIKRNFELSLSLNRDKKDSIEATQVALEDLDYDILEHIVEAGKKKNISSIPLVKEYLRSLSAASSTEEKAQKIETKNVSLTLLAVSLLLKVGTNLSDLTDFFEGIDSLGSIPQGRFKGWNLLTFAVAYNHVEAVNYFLNRATIEKLNDIFSTIIPATLGCDLSNVSLAMVGARSGSFAALKAIDNFITSHPEFNEDNGFYLLRSPDGFTPLMYAVECMLPMLNADHVLGNPYLYVNNPHYENTVKFFLEKGDKPTLIDQLNKTAIDYCEIRIKKAKDKSYLDLLKKCLHLLKNSVLEEKKEAKSRSKRKATERAEVVERSVRTKLTPKTPVSLSPQNLSSKLLMRIPGIVPENAINLDNLADFFLSKLEIEYLSGIEESKKLAKKKVIATEDLYVASVQKLSSNQESNEQNGFGLFAKTILAKNTFLPHPYTGLSKKQCKLYDVEDDHAYLFDFEVKSSRKKIRIYKDAKYAGNETRFINHSASPNCLVKVINGSIFFYTSEIILPGQQLTINYGVDYARTASYVLDSIRPDDNHESDAEQFTRIRSHYSASNPKEHAIILEMLNLNPGEHKEFASLKKDTLIFVPNDWRMHPDACVFIQKEKGKIEKTGLTYMMILCFVMDKSSETEAKALLRQNTLNYKTRNQFSAFRYLLYGKGSIEVKLKMIPILIGKGGALFDLHAEDFHTPLWDCLHLRNADLFKAIIAAEISSYDSENLDLKGSNKNNVLFLKAKEFGNPEILSILKTYLTEVPDSSPSLAVKASLDSKSEGESKMWSPILSENLSEFKEEKRVSNEIKESKTEALSLDVAIRDKLDKFYQDSFGFFEFLKEKLDQLTEEHLFDIKFTFGIFKGYSIASLLLENLDNMNVEIFIRFLERNLYKNFHWSTTSLAHIFSVMGRVEVPATLIIEKITNRLLISKETLVAANFFKEFRSDHISLLEEFLNRGVYLKEDLNIAEDAACPLYYIALASEWEFLHKLIIRDLVESKSLNFICDDQTNVISLLITNEQWKILDELYCRGLLREENLELDFETLMPKLQEAQRDELISSQHRVVIHFLIEKMRLSSPSVSVARIGMFANSASDQPGLYEGLGHKV